MVPVAESPAAVPVYDTQILTSRSTALDEAGSDPPPSGSPNDPGPISTVGPEVTLKSTGGQLCAENTAARVVVTPAGTLLNVIVGVLRDTAVRPFAHGLARQKPISPAETSLMMFSISAHGGWNSVPHSMTKP